MKGFLQADHTWIKMQAIQRGLTEFQSMYKQGGCTEVNIPPCQFSPDQSVSLVWKSPRCQNTKAHQDSPIHFECLEGKSTFVFFFVFFIVQLAG